MSSKGRRAHSGPEYRPDESQKRKHHWSEPKAGFVEGPSGERIGKCPVTMDAETAQALLDEAHPYRAKARKADPTYLYAVGDDGVLYRASWTVPGKSMHGFPEDAEKFPGGTQGARLRELLLEQARSKGREAELREWMQWPDE